MATENKIRAEGKKQLVKEGYLPWCPARVRYAENDIFGIFDCIAVKDSHTRFVQWTSKSNMRAREKKILAKFEEKNFFLPCEVWGWDKDKKKFVYLYI